MIAFRVDANETIATGHLYRCISVAEQLQRSGQDVVFLLSDTFGVKILDEKNIEYICLKNDFRDKENELAVLQELIRDKRIELLFLDSYQATENYIKELKASIPIAYMDDLLSIKEAVSIRIRPKFGCNVSEFIDKEIPIQNSKLLMGSEYVPLRSAFADKQLLVKEHVENIFITTGGTDHLNFINTMLKNSRLLMDESFTKHIVVGAFYDHMEELKAFAKNYSNIKIYQNISNIDEIMSMCDVGISAGGTTLAELCACGVATLCFSIADNQMKGVSAYNEAGMMIACGDYRQSQASVISNIENGLQRFVNDYDFRNAMVTKAHIKIDGKGAMRIAQEIIKYMREKREYE